MAHLTFVDAGFSTSVGFFGARTQILGGNVTVLEFEAPGGTAGEVHVPVLDCDGRVIVRAAGQGQHLIEDRVVDVVRGAQQQSVVVQDVAGGRWEATFRCSE